MLVFQCTNSPVPRPSQNESMRIEFDITRVAKASFEQTITYDHSEAQNNLIVSESIIRELEKQGIVKTFEQRKWMMNFHQLYFFSGKTNMHSENSIKQSLTEYNNLVPFPGTSEGILQISEEVSIVWVIMQDVDNIEEGSSKFHKITTRQDLLDNINDYIYFAKKHNKRLLITACNEDQSEWYHKDIIFNGKRVKESLYNVPDRHGTDLGAEIPL